MKKLRLIRPWQLRTVRQRLCEARTGYETVHMLTAAPAPVADAYSRQLTAFELRFAQSFMERTAFPAPAPRASIIFADINGGFPS